jgi:hypothetical protein
MDRVVLSPSGRNSLPNYFKEHTMAVATFTNNKSGITYNLTDPLYVVTTVIAAASFTSLVPLGGLTVLSFILAAFSLIGVGWGVGFFLAGAFAFIVGITAAAATIKRGFTLVAAGKFMGYKYN